MSENQQEQERTPRTQDPAFWRELWNQARLVFYLMRDSEVPAYLKLLPLIAIAYVLFPFDLAPDLVPILGQVDDMMALLVGAKVFVEMAPPHIVERYMDQLHGILPEDPLQSAIIVDAEHELLKEEEKRELQ